MISLRTFVLTLMSCTLLLLLAPANVFAQTDITVLGKAIRDGVSSGQMVSYKIPVSLLTSMSNNDYLSMVLSPYSGDADLYVSTSGIPTLDDSKKCTNCILSGSTPHGEVKKIKKSDPLWPTRATDAFYIGVYGYTAADFLLNAYTTNTHVILEEGASQMAHTIERQYTYFKFQLTDNSGFSIAVSPMNGDPDIFVSTSVEKPTLQDNDWSQSIQGFDSLEIKSNDTKFKPNTVYNIGVQAFYESYYTISINKGKTYVDLMEGIYANDFVEAYQYTYFKFKLKNPGNRLVIALNPLDPELDPDIYVTTNIEAGPPSKENHEWSQASRGGDVVIIEPAQALTYYIGIFGFMRKTSFQLVANTEMKNTMLNDGVSVPGYISNNQYAYYKFVHGDQEASLTITATPLGSGQVQLFGSRDNTHPDKQKHEFKGESVEGSGGGKKLIFNVPTTTGTYYLSVFSESGTNYTITAQTSQSTTVLKEGQASIFNVVPTGYYRYFVYEMPATTSRQDLSITVSPLQGDVDLYVSATVERPSMKEHTWSSDNWKQDTVVILSNDPKAEGKYKFYIAVYGASLSTTNHFSVLASVSSTTVSIQEGAIVSGAVTTDHYRYYRFEIEKSGSISMNLELTSGNDEAHLFVSKDNQKPNKHDYQWMSTEYGNDYLTIKNAYAGVYYIAVYGSYASGNHIGYTLTARQNDRSLPTNRVNMLEAVDAGVSYRFISTVTNHSEAILFATTLINGRTNMYISTSADKIPSKGNADFESTTWPGNAVLIPKSDPKFKTGDWMVVVEALEESDYFISASLLPYASWVNEGVPRFGVAPKQGYMLYAYWVPYTQESEQQNYYLSIRVVTGSLDVYVDQDFSYHPSPQNHTFSSTGPNDRYMELDKKKLKFGQTMYIALYSRADEDTYYEIVIGKHSTPMYLNLDQPQTLVTPPGLYAYFRLLNSMKHPHELQLFVESCSAEKAPVAYLSDNSNNKNPSKERHTFATKSTNNPLIQFVKTPKKQGEAYFAGVYGDAASVFSVYATASLDARPLVPNPILTGSSSKGNQIRLNIPVAKPPKRFADRVFYYTVYMMELHKTNNKYDPYNFETSCGIQHSGVEVGTAEVKPGAKSVQYLIDVDPKKDYAVNVIVSDNLGLASPYSPGLIVKGAFVSKRQSVNKVSVGAIFILLSVIAIVTYIIVGCAYNAYKGERGVHMIPNYGFWKDLPMLIWDGVMFVVTCGRRSDTSYSRFDTTVNTSGFGSSTISEEPIESSTSSRHEASGYGSI